MSHCAHLRWIKESFFLSYVSVCEGGDGEDAPLAVDPTAEHTLKNEATTDADAKPSTTTAGNFNTNGFL